MKNIGADYDKDKYASLRLCEVNSEEESEDMGLQVQL